MVPPNGKKKKKRKPLKDMAIRVKIDVHNRRTSEDDIVDGAVSAAGDHGVRHADQLAWNGELHVVHGQEHRIEADEDHHE
jgi:hypothetical protein